MTKGLPRRKKLPHETPSWVPDGSRYFITITCVRRGENHLCKTATAEGLIEGAKLYHQKGVWRMSLFLLMPDHVHAVLVFNPARGIKQTVRSWKSFQAKRWGIAWQSDFFEHRLRNDAEFVEKMHYVRMNPVRKKLAERAEDWPYVWVPEELGRRLGETPRPAS
jgi:putative transposase